MHVPGLAALGLILFAGMSSASPAQVRQIEIVSYGIYTAELQSAARDKSGVLQNVSRNITLQTQTTTIPIENGIRFGFNYKVIGSPAGGIVALRAVTVYPPNGVRSPAVSQPLYRNEEPTTAKIGDVSYRGYRLDDPWEMAPGEWHIQLWLDDRKLADQAFTLVAK